nr:MAG TPA: hypothetical protein [Caudoviricetes sp.]
MEADSLLPHTLPWEHEAHNIAITSKTSDKNFRTAAHPSLL